MEPIPAERVVLRRAVLGDMDRLIEIRSTPEVFARWQGDDLEAEFDEAMASDEVEFLAIEDTSGKVIGAIQWYEETDEMYRHAGMDIYLDPAVHGQGLGTESVRALCRYLFEEQGHHRLIIDPALDNEPAIRSYSKVGFREVGVMRQYERGADGVWHDGLLMELLADDLVD